MGLTLLDWEPIRERLEAATDAEAVLFDSEEYFIELDDEYSCLPDVSFEATDTYNGIRDALTPELLQLCDECFAPTFWNPDESDLEQIESPPITSTAKFSIVDLELHGGRLYVQSLISPDTLRALADLWAKLSMDDLRAATERAVQGVEWGWGDYIDSVDSWMRYVSGWKQVMIEGSRDERGLLIRA